MESDPQLFSWPGSRVVPNNPAQSGQKAPDPAQAAADAAAAGHQQGFDRGYAEGLAKGEQEAQAQVQQKFANVDAIFTEAESFATQWRAAQVELVQLVGAKFLLQELICDTNRLDHVLKLGQQLLPTSEAFRLACHPDLEAALNKQSQYTLIVDPQLPPAALELRQGCSCLQLDMDSIVAQAFASLEQVAIENLESIDEPAADLNSDVNPDANPEQTTHENLLHASAVEQELPLPESER